MNEQLRSELIAMKALDIATREKLVENGELKHDSYHPEMKAIHETNTTRMMAIIDETGWPSESMVGEDGAEAAWLIVQHAILEPQFQKRCLELLTSAIENGDANSWHLAYLQDRILTQDGKPQIYGTQHIAKDGKMQPLPIEDAATANKKRASLGLWSLEEHTAHLQKDYDTIQKNREKQNDE